MNVPPHAHGNTDVFAPRLIAWELTRSCPLRCRHCRASADRGPYEGELSFDEIARVVDSIAVRFKPILILTGGEPMLRTDLLDIIRYVAKAGMRPVMATCGSLLTEAKAAAIKEAGVERISVSLDGPDAGSHDAFRGVPGAFQSAMEGLDAARRAGLEFQINTTVTRTNVHRLEAVLDLAVAQGAVAFHPFLLVPTGRGKAIQEEVLGPEEYERVLNTIYDLKLGSRIAFKPTCAAHFYRVLRQREAEAGRAVTAGTHGLDAMSKGCMGGLSFAFIGHRGLVQICGFLDEVAGDVRAAGYDFARVWDESPLFLQLRDFANYKGKCGLCEYRRWCGGCRARAFGVTGDYMASEPSCSFEPKGWLRQQARDASVDKET